MVVGGSTNLVRFVRAKWYLFVLVAAIVAIVEVTNDGYDVGHTALSLATLGIAVTALSIFLVFRVNEAYARWWEARTLWGGIVNDSRSFGRQATTLVIGEPAASHRLVYRQIAWVNALRLELRQESDLESLAPFLEPEEYERLKTAANKPTQLAQTQAEDLAALREAGALDRLDRLLLESTLSKLTDHQGGCERIKNTAFPDRVAWFTHATAWALALMIALSMVDQSNEPDIVDMIVTPLLMLVFVASERLGSDLKDPFENRDNDTPMTALCRTIEIDLRQQLGETNLPPPIAPIDGILM